jgi:hypothetical protein
LGQKRPKQPWLLAAKSTTEQGVKFVQKRDVGWFHSITSSAVASNTGGTEMPSTSAVLRLITRSNLSGRCIGKSLGLAPCRIFARNPRIFGTSRSGSARKLSNRRLLEIPRTN